MNNTQNIPVVSENEMTMVNKENQLLSVQQMQYLFSKTPKHHIYTRPGKGGGNWNYVTGVYVKKVLNALFGWNWSFEVVEHKIDIALKQAYVLGKLTIKSNGHTIVKMQFGRVDIKFKRENVLDKEGNAVMVKNKYGEMVNKTKPSNIPLDVGNDLKAATTDALKKCASELGVASDVYAPNEFKEIKILEHDECNNDEKLTKIKDLLKNNLPLDKDAVVNLERIVDKKEVGNYDKAIYYLTEKLKDNGNK